MAEEGCSQEMLPLLPIAVHQKISPVPHKNVQTISVDIKGDCVFF